MTEQKKVEREGAGASETSHIAADPAPARRRRLTAARKQEAVLRVLRGEDVELVARALEATAATFPYVTPSTADLRIGDRENTRNDKVSAIPLVARLM